MRTFVKLAIAFALVSIYVYTTIAFGGKISSLKTLFYTFIIAVSLTKGALVCVRE